MAATIGKYNDPAHRRRWRRKLRDAENWYNIRDEAVPIITMEESYVVNVLRFLAREANFLSSLITDESLTSTEELEVLHSTELWVALIERYTYLTGKGY